MTELNVLVRVALSFDETINTIIMIITNYINYTNNLYYCKIIIGNYEVFIK